MVEYLCVVTTVTFINFNTKLLMDGLQGNVEKLIDLQMHIQI